MAAEDKETKFTKIQIASGNLNNKLLQNGLDVGELFWVTKNLKDPEENAIWSDGELYIGRPDGLFSDPMLIAGGRSAKALVYQGTITNEISINDKLFQHARVGDFWKFNIDASVGEFKVLNFHKDDFLLVTYADVDNQTGLTIQSSIRYIRVNNSLNAIDLASVEVDYNKYEVRNLIELIDHIIDTSLSWGGHLSSNIQLAQYSAAGLFKPSTVWKMDADNITLVSNNNATTTQSRKNDLWLFRDAFAGWELLSRESFYADEMPYELGTHNLKDVFSKNHLDKIDVLTSVKDALDFLITNKTELDKDGKIPVSQLPAEALGKGITYCGAWNPIVDERGITDSQYQNDWPSMTNKGEPVENGSMFIVNIDTVVGIDSTKINVQYYDKTALDINDEIIRVVELNTGDFILRNGTTWDVIDNTDRLSCINFFLNSKLTPNITKTIETKEEKTGNVDIGTANKIVLYREGTRYVISGFNLVDQIDGYTGSANFVPKYTNNETNTLTNSNIESTDDVTIVHSNFEIGTYIAPKTANVYGNLTLSSPINDTPIFTLKTSYATSLIANQDLSSDILLNLPKHSGTIATTDDVLKMSVDGTENYFPIFAQGLSPDKEKITIITNSSIHTVHNALLDSLDNNIYNAPTITDVLGVLKYYVDYAEFKDKFYPERKSDVVINSDVVIGTSKDPQNLHITNALSFGNENTTNTFVVPGRDIYTEDYNKKVAIIDDSVNVDSNGFPTSYWKIEKEEETNVYLGLPAKSGVLLSSNSVINGGTYVDENDEHTIYTPNVLFTPTYDWNIGAGSNDYEYVGGDLASIYKPDQNVNKDADVEFNTILTNLLSVSTIITAGKLDITAKHLYLQDKDGNAGTIHANLSGTAERAKEVDRISHSLTFKKVDNVNEVTETQVFDGSEDVTFKAYYPDQSVDKGSSPKFTNLNVEALNAKDLFIDYDMTQTKYNCRALPNTSGMDDDLLAFWGIEPSRQINYM